MISRNAPGAAPAGVRVSLAAAAFGLLAALPYLIGGIGRTFVAIDDDTYVSANPHLRDGLSFAGVRWALTSFTAGNWHPLIWLSHLANVSLFGREKQTS